MLVRKVFYKELVTNATKIFVVLVFILPVTELFKLLDQVSSGGLPIITVITLMIFGTLASFPMILTIACFLTIVITINRYCKDHEFSVWLASGVSPFYWFKQTVIFILPMTIICGICSMYITPWATIKSQNYINFLSKQETSIALAPGVFKENNDGNQVFYIENYSLVPSFARKIFVQYNDNTKGSYNVTANAGRIEKDNGIVSILLEDGHRYHLGGDSNQNINLSFKQFRVGIKQKYKPLDHNYLDLHTVSMSQLLSQQHMGAAKAELSWRISIAIMLLVMSCLAIPLSIQIGRVQNSLIFILLPVIYALYQNALLTLNDYIGHNEHATIWYVLFMHASLFVVAIGITYLKSLPKGYLWSKNK